MILRCYMHHSPPAKIKNTIAKLMFLKPIPIYPWSLRKRWICWVVMDLMRPHMPWENVGP